MRGMVSNGYLHVSESHFIAGVHLAYARFVLDVVKK